MICPKCAHTMSDELTYCECCGTYLAAPQPKLRVVSTSTYRFDVYDQLQGGAVASAAPSAQATAAFYNMYEPAGQPIMGMGSINVPRATASVPTSIKRKERRSRKMRTLFSASIISMLLLGFGGGMTAFAIDDADSRMPIVMEYEKTVTPDVTTSTIEAGDGNEVTIVDDPVPMASSPFSTGGVTDVTSQVEPAVDEAPVPGIMAGTLEQPQTETVVEPLAPYTLDINGTRVPYIHSVFAALCPDHNAALWAGSDDTTDGSYGYFIGHNPGDFACVYALVPGNCVTLCDSNGNLRNYTVGQLYDVPNTTALQDLLGDVIPQGECLVLQTCIGDGSYYRIVVCE